MWLSDTTRLPCMQSDKFCPISLIFLCPVPAPAKWCAPASKIRKVVATGQRVKAGALWPPSCSSYPPIAALQWGRSMQLQNASFKITQLEVQPCSSSIAPALWHCIEAPYFSNLGFEHFPLGQILALAASAFPQRNPVLVGKGSLPSPVLAPLWVHLIVRSFGNSNTRDLFCNLGPHPGPSLSPVAWLCFVAAHYLKVFTFNCCLCSSNFGFDLFPAIPSENFHHQRPIPFALKNMESSKTIKSQFNGEHSSDFTSTMNAHKNCNVVTQSKSLTNCQLMM